MKICVFGNQIINEREFITLNDNENIENVREIVYLGSLILDNYDDTKEIRRILCIARNAMVSLMKIWKDKSTSLKTKKRLLQSLVFIIASYGSEYWVLKKEIKRKLKPLNFGAISGYFELPGLQRKPMNGCWEG